MRASPYGSIWRRRVRPAILYRDRRRCRYCGGYANTVDHVVAIAEGGARYDPDNLVAACLRCNSARGAEVAARRSKWRRAGGPGPRRITPGAIDLNDPT